MEKTHMKTYADAHNHLNGILPVEAIKIMLSRAREHWDRDNGRHFHKIPEALVPNAKELSFSNSSVTIDYGWIDCLDVLCRLIVFSVLDMENNGDSNQHRSKDYQKSVSKMLFTSGAPDDGRGMNSAGLLVSGCIGLRCLLEIMDNDDPDRKKLEAMDRCIAYLQEQDTDEMTLGKIFLGACVLDLDKEITPDNWLFSKFRMSNLDPQLQAFAEQLAVASVTAALSTSLWVPYDDCYALRGLLRRGDRNSVNYLMLTFRWLLEKEAVRGNYFSEISIGVGDLEYIVKTAQTYAEEFGFKEPIAGGIDRHKFLPLILEKHTDPKKSQVKISHRNRLYLRFLSGFVNSQTVGWDSDVEKAIKNGLKKIKSDQVYGCWAGVDMFGLENFVYDSHKFKRWLDVMYETLREIKLDSGGNRNLWLRPHAGEGAWVEDYPARIGNFDRNPLSLARKLRSLADFFCRKLPDAKCPLALNEVLEFIYRSIFTGWLPIDDVRAFYGGEAFTNVELQRLSALFQPVDPARGDMGEKIGTANLETLIDWINQKSPQTVEQLDRNYPQVRIGHGTHLGFDSVWGALTDLVSGSFMFVWVDLNLGSNIVTSARNIRSTIEPNTHVVEADNQIAIERVIKSTIDNSRFTCGHIQTELVERSERIAQFIDLIRKQGVVFVLGTDGQGTELTSIFRERLHFQKLVSWYFKDQQEAESMNKILKSNSNRYLSYAMGNVSELMSKKSGRDKSL